MDKAYSIWQEHMFTQQPSSHHRFSDLANLGSSLNRQKKTKKHYGKPETKALWSSPETMRLSNQAAVISVRRHNKTGEEKQRQSEEAVMYLGRQGQSLQGARRVSNNFTVFASMHLQCSTLPWCHPHSSQEDDTTDMSCKCHLIILARYLNDK